MAVAEVQMSSFGAQALSNVLWALAKLGRRPADTWLSTALARMEAIMHTCTPQVSTALQADCSARRPTVCHLTLIKTAAGRGFRLQSAVQAMCNVAWSLVVMEHSPSASWRRAFLYHSRLALEFATPRVSIARCFALHASILPSWGATN